eukprot:CAMPEP_0116925358 /NCGR_PEP_ID=MMETSP0467-20121206/24073_1 /TAXON_ID=283647 /ORGANISM="Mesodinium pulex, Strain SPMC105" /LENGTH=60 /DNA_ID=CAMNT_0004604391 /DNA_START=1334 /DNA_END=1516 /DNA_ORIENTATION=-
MTDDIDIDCGVILTKQKSIEEVGTQIFEYLLKIASGDKSKSEDNDYGDEEFIPWLIGCVM